MTCDDIIFIGKFKHKRDCDSPIVNPVTEWAGGNFVVIIGYKCSRCHVTTYLKDA